MKKLILLGLIIIIAGAGYLHYKNLIYTSIDPENDTTVSFQIKKGETAKQIAKNLKEHDLIKSPISLYTYTKIHNLGEKILAGRFALNQTMNIPEILAAITDPSKAESILTIQEGLTIADIDTKLVELGLTEPGDIIEEARNFTGWEYYKFLNQSTLDSLDLPVEGYLYPDTYFLNGGDFQPHDIIYLALDNFENKWEGIANKPESRIFKKYSIHEIITMASIIENEIFGEKDRQLVSGILWKRLENGWPLGADATLLYITEDRTITAEDLELDSPYNTRKFKGLPPGPISNPSVESIYAALFPTSDDYWFYLTTPDTGEVIYAISNEEHNTNKTKYLKTAF